MALTSEPRSGYNLYRARRRRAPYIVGGLLIVLVIVVAAGVIAIESASAGLSADPAALARIGMPLGGGKIESVSAFGGRDDHAIPVVVRGDQIWPRGTIPAGESVSIEVVVKRPGWNAWFAGSRDRVDLTLVAPAASLTQTYLTIPRGQPLKLTFNHPVAALAAGPTPSGLKRVPLAAPSSEVTVPRDAVAGTMWVTATPRTWETIPPTAISWFPSGAATAAVSYPAPGARIGPTTAITLTFSKPISAALRGSRPPVSPAGSGRWQQVSSHTLVFRPSGYGYGLGATVRIGLPAGVRLAGATGDPTATWHVAPGSTRRLQQLLATLGYLPLNFTPSTPVADNPAAQEHAAVHPPAGTFSWRYPNVPSALRSVWQPGASGTVTQGAIMAFENDQGMTTDGIASPALWKALIAAAIAGKRSTFGYTFVTVSEGSPETETTWHDGRVVVSGPVNTGIPEAPTATGLYPVFEHALSVTMSGTNPDGSHYSDPGIPFVSYFNGGDALHYFPRGGYGYPQSLGCVEMPYGEAEAVYPYTPIGTLVNVV